MFGPTIEDSPNLCEKYQNREDGEFGGLQDERVPSIVKPVTYYRHKEEESNKNSKSKTKETVDPLSSTIRKIETLMLQPLIVFQQLF